MLAQQFAAAEPTGAATEGATVTGPAMWAAMTRVATEGAAITGAALWTAVARAAVAGAAGEAATEGTAVVGVAWREGAVERQEAAIEGAAVGEAPVERAVRETATEGAVGRAVCKTARERAIEGRHGREGAAMGEGRPGAAVVEAGVRREAAVHPVGVRREAAVHGDARPRHRRRRSLQHPAHTSHVLAHGSVAGRHLARFACTWVQSRLPSDGSCQ